MLLNDNFPFTLSTNYVTFTASAWAKRIYN
jgi:hypothetical protein